MSAPQADGPLLLAPNLSHSQKSTLSECGGRYYLERAQRVPSQPLWASTGGSAAHAATEELDRRLYEAGEHISDLDDIADIFHSHLRLAIEDQERRSGFERTEFTVTGRASKDFPNKEGEDFWRQKGPGMVKSWVAYRDSLGFQIPSFDVVDEETGEVESKLAVELEFRFHVEGLPPEVEVHGFIDRVFHQVDPISGDDVYFVVDLKFGSREPSGPDQLVTYRHGLSLSWGIDPRWGAFWMGRKAQSTTPYDLSRHPLEQTMYEMRMAHRQRMAGDFRYHPSNLCNSCGVREYCPVFGGRFADTIPQPWEITDPIGLRPPRDDV